MGKGKRHYLRILSYTIDIEIKMFEEQDEFTITLLSNASYDIYPDNNVFNFSTVLAKPLRFESNDDWRVCLQSISLTNISDDPEFDKERISIVKKTRAFKAALKKAKKAAKTGNISQNFEALKIIYAQSKDVLRARVKLFNRTNTVFINCDEINPVFEDDRHLSSFVIPPLLKKEGEFMFYEPTTEEYFNLNSPIIEKITIKILNPDGLKIYRTVAQPTVVVLKFKKMKCVRKSYTINVTNKDQDPADFTTKFPYLPIPEGSTNPWEVAVTRVNLVSCFRKFPPGKFPITIVKNADDFGPNFSAATWETYIADKPKATAYFEYEEAPTNEIITAVVREAFETACDYLQIKGTFEKYNKAFFF